MYVVEEFEILATKIVIKGALLFPLEALQNPLRSEIYHLKYFPKKIFFKKKKEMKAWIVLLLAVLAFVVEPRCCIAAKENEQKLKIYTVKFTTKGANRMSYQMFMKDLQNALTVRADRSGDRPVLPPRSADPSDPQKYLLVKLSNGYQTVTLALDVTNVYILGYQPGGSRNSYFFSNVSTDVRNALFPNTRRASLPFTGSYGELETAALPTSGDRRVIPLGIDELRQHVDNMNSIQPSSDRRPIARALIVCIQMISEAVRFRNIQQELLTIAEPPHDGTYNVFYPDGLVMRYETNWDTISTAIQSATDGIFRTAVHLVYDGQVLVLSTVRQVLFIIAIMPLRCRRNTGANLQLLRMPTSMSSSGCSPLLPVATRTTGLEDNGGTCEKDLAPTSHIIGLDGLCVDVYQGSYHNGNKIVLSECLKNQAGQLWTLKTDDNTIRSGGKCLTTYGYSLKDYVMIYDCYSAVPDATKWEIRGDGNIRNPKSGLVLTANKYSSTTINLVVDRNIYSSTQAWFVSNNTEPTVTTIVGYNGFVLAGK